MSFLDPELVLQPWFHPPPSHSQLYPLMLDGLHNPSSISSKYFAWAHLWLPIISKSRLESELTDPSASLPPEMQVLLFAMKLIMWRPSQEPSSRNGKTAEYRLIKQSFAAAEDSGDLNLRLLQALIIVATYELAHAIYPAAYFTVAQCVRYGTALQLHKQRRNEVMHLNLEDQEERKRVWWATIILDQICSHSMPISPDPRPDDLLPIHDRDWDNNSIDHARMYTVSSPASTNMGMFARLSQASYLMGRVFHHTDNPTGYSDFDQDEGIRLDKALRALLNLIYEEDATNFVQVCPQTAICFTALIKLHTKPGTPLKAAETLELLRAIADESTLNIVLFFRREPWSLEKSSPFLLHWTYGIAVTFLDIWKALGAGNSGVEEGENFMNADQLINEARQGFETMRRKLSLLGTQWCAADVYLRLLDIRMAA
ncbi:hypothetical protein H2198_003834 [Neophaeococcomyces mojaviensis]|uniref:Uncharacterized protein n=1 Tax=Neophaeococcomyces mojaviensis TaxID=3383035 RepID=A0ACC3AAC2_9EURO|nr:hypothetical protein H2198_003834 [Knufia sp. JES_112]